MNKIKTIFIVLCSFVLLANGVSAFAGQHVAKEIDKLVNQYMQSYKKHDVSSITSLYDKNAVLLAACNCAPAIGRKQIASTYRDEFKSVKSADFNIKRVSVVEKKDTVVALYHLKMITTLQDGQIMHENMRMTLTLKDEKGEWKILQSHFSLPVKFYKPDGSIDQDVLRQFTKA